MKSSNLLRRIQQASISGRVGKNMWIRTLVSMIEHPSLDIVHDTVHINRRLEISQLNWFSSCWCSFAICRSIHGSVQIRSLPGYTSRPVDGVVRRPFHRFLATLWSDARAISICKNSPCCRLSPSPSFSLI